MRLCRTIAGGVDSLARVMPGSGHNFMFCPPQVVDSGIDGLRLVSSWRPNGGHSAKRVFPVHSGLLPQS